MQSTQQTGSATAAGAAAGSAPSSGPHRSLVSLARAARPSLGSTAVTPRSFTIRWDRTAIALLVVLGLLTAVITGLAALFGAPTGAVAGISLLVAALGVAGLRLLALRDRKRRTDRQIEAAFEEAAAPASVGTVFDAAASAPWAVRTAAAAEKGSASVEEPDTAPDVSASTPAPANESATEQTVPSAARATAPTQLSVPRPTYLDAPEAVRPEPQPLELPEVKTAQPGTRLKDGVSAEYTARVQASANRTLDLDKVLERRRAV